MYNSAVRICDFNIIIYCNIIYLILLFISYLL
jgi:hypothetical protein